SFGRPNVEGEAAAMRPIAARCKAVHRSGPRWAPSSPIRREFFGRTFRPIEASLLQRRLQSQERVMSIAKCPRSKTAANALAMLSLAVLAVLSSCKDGVSESPNTVSNAQTVSGVWAQIPNTKVFDALDQTAFYSGPNAYNPAGIFAYSGADVVQIG